MKPGFIKRSDDSTSDNLGNEIITSPQAMGAMGISREDAERMAEDAATRAVELERKQRKKEEKDDDSDLSVISSKTVNELKNIAAVFNALKEFSANPLQKAIENKVGDVAAGVVERSFGERPEPPKKDFVETVLNSQLAFGLGQGIGARAPELLESANKVFGPQKTEQMANTLFGMGGGKGGSGMGGGAKSSGIESLLALDHNNPEHVAAYAEFQGGISIDLARKMLLMQQDDLMKRNIQKMQQQVQMQQGVVGGGVVGGVEEYKVPNRQDVQDVRQDVRQDVQDVREGEVREQSEVAYDADDMDSRWEEKDVNNPGGSSGGPNDSSNEIINMIKEMNKKNDELVNNIGSLKLEFDKMREEMNMLKAKESDSKESESDNKESESSSDNSNKEE